MSKYTVYGLPGVYNSVPLSLNEGDGVALAVTSAGQLIVVNADGTPVGAGIEYTAGAAVPGTIKAPSLVFNNAGTWAIVGSATPLPVTGSFTPSGTQDVNLKQVGGATFALGQALAAASLPVVLTAAQITTLTPPATVAVTQSTSPWVISGSVTATLSAETTKVIGTVNQGTSPWVISGAVTEAALDAALISQEATTSGIKGLTIFGAVTTNAPSYTTAKSDALSLDTSGLLRISLKDTPANTNKFLVTPDSVALPANQSVNVSQMNGVTVSMGTGVMGTGVQRVAIASDNDALTVKQTTAANLNTTAQITDGTNIANVLKSDGTAAGQNSQIVSSAYLSVAFTTTSVAAVASTDAGNYRSVSVQITTQGGSSTVTFQGSNDNTNWFSTALMQTTGTAQAPVTSTTSAATFYGAITTRYFRLNVTGIVSGTTAGQVVFSAMPTSPMTFATTATQSGTWSVQSNSATGSAPPANAFYIAGNDGTNLRGFTINSTTFTSKFAMDGNLLGTLGTAFTSAGKVNVHGAVATNVAITDNPLNLGAQAVSSENAAVTTARQVQLVADLVGKLIVLPYANPENFVSGAITSAMTGTTTTSLIGAPAAGLRNYITQITVSNSHATVGTDVIIQDGSGGTTLYTIPAAAVYGGAAITFPTPLKQPTTATAIYCANVTTGASTKVSASGYKGV